MPRIRQLFLLAIPSAVAALAAALAAGLVEGLRHGRGWWADGSGAGVAATGSVPAGFALALLVRALWRSWSPVLAEPATSDPLAASQAGARIAGGLWFGILALLLIGTAGWTGALAAGSLTHVPVLAALTVGLFALAAGAIAALLSAPAVRALSNLVLAFDRHRGHTGGRGVVTPARVLTCTGFVALGLALALWLALLVRPPGGPALYLVTFGIGLVAAHAGAARFGRQVLGRWNREERKGGTERLDP